MNEKALVLFSGGQDSTTCLAWALDKYQKVETIGFDYRQRHSVELDCRLNVLRRIRKLMPAWGSKLGEDHLIDLPVLSKISDTALTRDVEISLDENDLPSTFVPGRNLVFLTFAGIVAYRRGSKHLVAGMCETDYSGYPDCRDDAVKAFQAAMNLGMDTRFVIHSPLIWSDKAETWSLAKKLGGKELVDLIIEETHTCYLGDREQKYPWGYGCGTCPACELRAKGWEIYSGTEMAGGTG
jgi:7-cyano-7-deazaguanine synthase